MEAFECRCYEVCGFWTIVVVRVWQHEDGHVERDMVYKGDHTPIDEPDPVIRSILLLSRVVEDLEHSLRPEGWNPLQHVPH